MRAALALALVCSLGAPAAGTPSNSGPKLTVSLEFRKGHDADIVAGLTFGMVISHDGGATWHWMCEKALHYGAPTLPDYAYARSGALYCASHSGAFANRDGCAFEPTVHDDIFMSVVAIGPDDALYMAASEAPTVATGDPGDARIYKSTDDGATFPTSADPGQPGDKWTSLEVAPSDAQRLYLTGYRPGSPRVFKLFRSDDGGSSFQPMSFSGITTTADSEIYVGGIDAADPDVLYLRISYQALGVSDGIFRSVDGGQSWTRVYTVTDTLAFVVRAGGELVVSGRASGMFRSADRGDTWTEVLDAPGATCLAENAAGDVWACTPNHGVEDAAIMKSTDLVTWTKVMRYQDIDGPVECPAGTLQHDVCVADPGEWCVLRSQLAIVADPTTCVAPDGAVPDGAVADPPCDGCCCRADGGRPSTGALAILGAVGAVVLRRRRPVRRIVSR